MWFSQIRDALIKLGFCILPLALTAALVAFIAAGYASDAENTLRLLIPWLLWSLVYTAIFIMLWLMRLSLERNLAYSAGGSTILISLVWIMMAIWFSGYNGYSVL